MRQLPSCSSICVGVILTDLYEKAGEGERVLPQHDTPAIADDLRYTSPDHSKEESPSSPSDALEDLDGHDHREQCEQNGIGGEGGAVLVQAGFGRTCAQIAGLIWAIGARPG